MAQYIIHGLPVFLTVMNEVKLVWGKNVYFLGLTNVVSANQDTVNLTNQWTHFCIVSVVLSSGCLNIFYFKSLLN